MGGRITLFLSAGEVSGDLHGAHLARALSAALPGVRLVGVGGARMREAGVEVLADVTAHSAVGLTEQLPHVWPVLKAFQQAKRALAELRPQAVVLVDYQGANLDLARHARTLGLPTVYYIAPQDWLWGFKRGPAKVAAAVDRLIAVFPREADVYRAAGARVDYVGHPLIDILAASGLSAPAEGAPLVALLPGSRAQEVAALLPVFLDAAARLHQARPGLRFALPVASPHLEAAARAAIAGSNLPIELHAGRSHDLLRRARVALAASGTATLEAALLDVPCVAAYKVSALTAWIAERLLHGRYVTLPNIVAEREVIPECLQARACGAVLAETALGLLDEGPARAAMQAGYAEVRERLGGPGAVARAAAVIREVALGAGRERELANSAP